MAIVPPKSKSRAPQPIITICALCKRQQDRVGHWQEHAGDLPDQQYISHGLCPRCAHQLYPEFFPNPHEIAL